MQVVAQSSDQRVQVGGGDGSEFVGPEIACHQDVDRVLSCGNAGRVDRPKCPVLLLCHRGAGKQKRDRQSNRQGYSCYGHAAWGKLLLQVGVGTRHLSWQTRYPNE